MNIGRMYGLFLRHFFLITRSFPRILDLIYWPTIQITLWGFISNFFTTYSSYYNNAVGIILTCAILYDFLFRTSIGFNMLFLEEIWSRNFTNLFISPIKKSEILISLIFTALVRALIGLVPAILLTSPLFGISILDLGLSLFFLFLSLYIFGITLGWFLCKRIFIKDVKLNEKFDDYITYLIFGIILGGRLGYVIFYNFDFYINNPLLILSLWEGGMSFHGGAIGVILAIIAYSKYYRIPVLETGDVICAVVPIGLFFGRIANFINGELWGKETNFSWGVIFPNAGINPRHPSQLYEAGLEGLILFIILLVMVFNNGLKKKGLISGTFLFFYSFSRIIIENFREPDSHIGYIIPNITMGMILSLPFLVAGLILIFRSIKNEYS